MKPMLSMILFVVKVAVILIIIAIPYTIGAIKEAVVFGYNCGEEAFNNLLDGL